MMDIKIILLIILLFVVIDKGLTVINLTLVKQNYPEVDSLKVEKNIAQRWFFEKLGLIGGAIVFGIITFLLTWLAYLAASRFLGESVALYCMFILYFFVFGNNIYFMLKYGGIIS